MYVTHANGCSSGVVSLPCCTQMRHRSRLLPTFRKAPSSSILLPRLIVLEHSSGSSDMIPRLCELWATTGGRKRLKSGSCAAMSGLTQLLAAAAGGMTGPPPECPVIFVAWSGVRGCARDNAVGHCESSTLSASIRTCAGVDRTAAPQEAAEQLFARFLAIR